jgi:hypothetical protein
MLYYTKIMFFRTAAPSLLLDLKERLKRISRKSDRILLQPLPRKGSKNKQEPPLRFLAFEIVTGLPSTGRMVEDNV